MNAISFLRRAPFALSVLVCLSALTSALAAEVSLKVQAAPAPSEVAAAIASGLQKEAVQLLEGGKPVFEFWFASSVPFSAPPASLAKALDSVKQTTLLGVVRVGTGRHDYRDDDIAPGVYTMRMVIQPNDGNHLGSAEFSWFAALIPCRLDKQPDGIKDYKSLTKASSKETTTDHPVVLSLRPAGSADGALPQLVEPAPEHKSVRVKLAGKAGDAPASVVFELVYEGKGHK